VLSVVADYSTSVRVFEALREKTENKTQYDAYVNELKPVREELGITSEYVTDPRNSAKGGDVAWRKVVNMNGNIRMCEWLAWMDSAIKLRLA
jgi:Cytochrome c oxidase subunit Va